MNSTFVAIGALPMTLRSMPAVSSTSPDHAEMARREVKRSIRFLTSQLSIPARRPFSKSGPPSISKSSGVSYQRGHAETCRFGGEYNNGNAPN